MACATSIEDSASATAAVLLVDDRPANLLALRAILDDLDIRFTEAHGGDEAIARLRTEEFAAILLDVKMPGLDGFETAKHIRSEERSRHTPIIFLTAYDDYQMSAEQAYSLGAVDYLTKPLVPAILRAKVQRFVDLFREKQKAQQETEQLRMLIDGTSEYAIFMLDVDGHVVTWNAGARRLTGYSSDEIIGQHFSVFYPDELIRRRRPDHELRTARAEGRYDEEGYRVRKDGTIYWANVVITALYDASGQLRGFSKITRDMSERKQAQANERRLLEEEARRQIAEAEAAAVQLEHKRLEEADRRKDQFLATLAHELRNPLAPLRNSLQVLQLSANDAATVRQLCNVMARQIDVLVRLVDDLLDVSRVTRGKIDLRIEQIQLADVVSRAVESVHPMIEQRAHQLTVNLPSEPLTLETDAVRLTQIIGNLLANSAKYTDPHGHILFEAIPSGDWIRLRIQDNGIGIAPELLPKVFDLFTQADISMTKSQGGLGIGLTLVKSLVEMLGGKVEARSEGLGKGSEFSVRLPIATPTGMKSPSQKVNHVELAPQEQRRLLVVDDNMDAANSLGLLLRLKGHQVQVAYDGASALEIAGNQPPEIAFLDIGMPDMDGYELARRLREIPEAAGITLAALTGWGQQDEQERSARAGFDYHLVKPVDMATLDSLLTNVRKPK